MQQVFGMVNNLLSKENETRERKLSVRQYKVMCEQCMNADVIMLDDVMLFNKAHHAILLSMYSRFIITIVSIATR